MGIKEKMDEVMKHVSKGRLALSEAEMMLDEAIREDCMSILSDPVEWGNRYYKLKRRSWRLLLEATKNVH